MFKALKNQFPFLKTVIGNVYTFVIVSILNGAFAAFILPSILNADTFSFLLGIFAAFISFTLEVVLIGLLVESLTETNTNPKS